MFASCLQEQNEGGDFHLHCLDPHLCVWLSDQEPFTGYWVSAHAAFYHISFRLCMVIFLSWCYNLTGCYNFLEGLLFLHNAERG